MSLKVTWLSIFGESSPGRLLQVILLKSLGFLPIPYTGFKALRAGLVKKNEEYELKTDEQEEITRLAEYDAEFSVGAYP